MANQSYDIKAKRLKGDESNLADLIMTKRTPPDLFSRVALDFMIGRNIKTLADENNTGIDSFLQRILKEKRIQTPSI